jgi:hypothetical protein
MLRRCAVCRIFPLLLIPLFLACADKGDGGGDDVVDPSLPRVAGTWSYSISNLSGGGITCFQSGTTLNLYQYGATVTGSFSGGVFVCGLVTVFVTDGRIINGSVTSGGAVSFDMRTCDWHNSGILSADSMSGTTTVPVDPGPPVGRVTLTGTFAAVRQ